MVAQLIMGGTVLLGIAYVYHLGSEHAKDLQASKSAIQVLTYSRDLLKQEIEEKNEYIKDLEVQLVSTATPPALASLLSGLFQGGEDSLLTGTDMPSLPAPTAPEADLHSVGGLSATND